jgi:FkbM family methyltransferase
MPAPVGNLTINWRGRMLNLLKRIAGRLPKRWQQSLKRFHFGRQIRRHRFVTREPEYEQLQNFVSPGDWVVDVGANVGHYTVRLSELVGSQGRVAAFEPVPETFELLAANVALLPSKNVTLINAAASDRAYVSSMSIPVCDTGLDNNYMAQLSTSGSGPRVLCLPIDDLHLPHAVRLVKVDAEGHELPVLKGMVDLLERDRPVLIVEDNDDAVTDWLEDLGYTGQKLPKSSNRLFQNHGVRKKKWPQILELRVRPRHELHPDVLVFGRNELESATSG